MIPTLIIIITALAWLIKETDFFTVRLETTEYQKAIAKFVKSELITEDGLKTRETELPENTIPYKPSDFTPLDMPETSGNLNIICVRE